MSVFSIELTNVTFSAIDKYDCLEKIIRSFHEQGFIDDFQPYYDELKTRENKYSTGIGYGIAIPHIRHKSITQLRAAVYLLDNPIDYESVDRVKVRLVVMFVIPDDGMAEYLYVIKKITEFLRSVENREKVFKVSDRNELYKIFRGLENEL
jgi:mannitol/fructose-specific phosphotransferase system IIA component (Ntr-type)